MSDIKYKWAKAGAVGLAKELSLPQFKVLGHRQKEKVIDLTTGRYLFLFQEGGLKLADFQTWMPFSESPQSLRLRFCNCKNLIKFPLSVYSPLFRQLLETDMRNSVRSKSRFLPDSDLHTSLTDRRHQLGILLAAP